METYLKIDISNCSLIKELSQRSELHCHEFWGYRGFAPVSQCRTGKKTSQGFEIPQLNLGCSTVHLYL